MEGWLGGGNDLTMGSAGVMMLGVEIRDVTLREGLQGNFNHRALLQDWIEDGLAFSNSVLEDSSNQGRTNEWFRGSLAAL